jgi:DNA-binding LacI/PurR family transcriptional regulator
LNRITIQKVAELAGVSIATVSRTMRSPKLVRPETQRRVMDIIKTHNYIYHATAADLSRQRSSTIGMLLPSHHVFTRTTAAILEKAQESDFTVIVGNTRYDSSRERTLWRQFQERRPAGIICTGFNTENEQYLSWIQQAGIPCILIWEKPSDPTVSYVGFDNYKAAYDMAAYLISLGHERIGLIIGPYSKVGRVKQRLLGYLDCLKAHGLASDSDMVVEKEPMLADGMEAMARLMSHPQPPTAVFAASDILAIGALAAAGNLGLRVPDDVSVAGFDDIEFAAFSQPALTTVRVHGYEIGEMAVKLLLEMIHEDTPQVRQFCFPTDLVVRNSCRALNK